MGLLNGIERKRSIAEVLVDGESMQVVVHPASGFARLRGLIARPPMRGDAALRFTRCRSVHGCLMRRELFVVFLDRNGNVTSSHLLKPWRFASDRTAAQVLEFEIETARRLAVQRATKFIFAEKG